MTTDIENGLVEVPVMEVNDWRKETFEARLSAINLHDRTKGDRIVQTVRLSFDDNGPDMDLNGLPESGDIHELKSFTDLGRFIALFQKKGCKVEVKPNNGRYEVFRIVPSILGSMVKMVATPREYYDERTQEMKKATNWRMEIIELNDSATKGFVSSPNAPVAPTNKEDTADDSIVVMESVKEIITTFLDNGKVASPEKYWPTNEIVKYMRLKLHDDKLIAAYSKLREQALRELVDDCIIEKEGGNLYRIL